MDSEKDTYIKIVAEENMTEEEKLLKQEMAIELMVKVCRFYYLKAYYAINNLNRVFGLSYRVGISIVKWGNKCVKSLSEEELDDCCKIYRYLDRYITKLLRKKTCKDAFKMIQRKFSFVNLQDCAFPYRIFFKLLVERYDEFNNNGMLLCRLYLPYI